MELVTSARTEASRAVSMGHEALAMSDAGVHSSPAFRVLWADDNADLCRSVSGLLARRYELRVSSDAETALDFARQDPPALVCVGAGLFTRSGVPLLSALRALPALRDATLVLSCPRGQEAYFPDELLANADDLLLTPFSLNELTTRVHAHERRWRARSEDRADTTFLSTVGHELRTPLTAILLWASSLRNEAKSGSELDRALRCIAASAQGQSRRIDDLLDLSRLAAGTLALNRRRAPMSALLHGIWEELTPLAAAKHIALQIEVAEPLGEAEVDPGRIQQVLSNLVSNAIKFTREGGGVKLCAHRHEAGIEIEVSDTGEGIASQLMPRLFERFQQRGEGEVRQAGLGIGLALSRQLVELHGGSISAHSAGPGQGASFRVRLPLAPEERGGNREMRTGRGAGAKPLRDRTVLLVEDHDETREAMQFVLERAGGRVLAADSGLSALALLGVDAPAPGARNGANADVIVCDLGLPDMTGYEFIARVVDAYERDRLPVPPSCAVSAHAREVDRQRAIQAGFDLHLAKPITADALIEAVDDLCQVVPTVVGSAITLTA